VHRVDADRGRLANAGSVILARMGTRRDARCPSPTVQRYAFAFGVVTSVLACASRAPERLHVEQFAQKPMPAAEPGGMPDASNVGTRSPTASGDAGSASLDNTHSPPPAAWLASDADVAAWIDANLAHFRELLPAPPSLTGLFRGPRATLYADERSFWSTGRRRCVRLDLDVSAGVLSTYLPSDPGPGKPSLRGFVFDFRAGQTATLGGPHSIVVEADGSESMAAYPFLRPLGILGHASREVLLYDAVPVSVTTACVSERVVRACDRPPGECVVCEKLGTALHSLSETHGFGRWPRVRQGLADDGGACVPCPEDTLAARMPRIDAYLSGKTFLTRTIGGLALHRTHAACTRDLRRGD
jgi:hypothetical protein